MNKPLSRGLVILAPVLYLLIAASLAALLAYPFQTFVATSVPLPKIVSKITLLLLILGIFPCMKKFNLSMTDIGLQPNKKDFVCQLVLGVLIGSIILSIVIMTLLCLDIRVADESKMISANNIIPTALKAMLIGIIIAFVEEPLFRGLLLSSFIQRIGHISSIFFCSFYYAALHFLRSDIDIPASQIDWRTGFLVLLDAFKNIIDLQQIDSFIALFVVGIFLACVRTRFKYGLGYCIGLHAGWVGLIKLTKSLTDGNSNTQWSFLVGSYDGIIGSLSTVWIIALTLALILWIPKTSSH